MQCIHRVLRTLLRRGRLGASGRIMAVPCFHAEGGPVIVLKRINNNAVLCIDPAGHQVVALGKGLAQCTVGKDVDLNLVDHTFYDVEPRYVELMRDLSLDYLEVSAQIGNVARGMLRPEPEHRGRPGRPHSVCHPTHARAYLSFGSAFVRSPTKLSAGI